MDWVNQQIHVVEGRRYACEKKKLWLSEFRRAFNEDGPALLMESNGQSEQTWLEDEIYENRFLLQRFGVSDDDMSARPAAVLDSRRFSMLEMEQLALKRKLMGLKRDRQHCVPHAVSEDAASGNRSSGIEEVGVSRSNVESVEQVSPRAPDQHRDFEVLQDEQAAVSGLRFSAREALRARASTEPAVVLRDVEEPSGSSVFKMIEATIRKLDEDRASLDVVKASLEEDRQQLQRQVRALEADPTCSNVEEAHHEMLERDLQEARDECDKLAALSHQSVVESTRLSKRNAELEQELIDLRAMQDAERDAHQIEMTELRRALCEKEWHIEQIGLEKRAADGSRNSQSRRILDLERDLVRARISEKECEKLKWRVQELDNHLADTTHLQEHATKQCSVQGQQIVELQQLLSDAQSHAASNFATLEDELARSRVSEEYLEHEILERSQEVARLEVGVEHKEIESRLIVERHVQESQEHQQSLAIARDRLASMQAAHTDMYEEHQALLSRAADLEQDVNEGKAEAARRSSVYQQQIAHWEHQAETLGHTQEMHIQRCTTYQEKIAELETELAQSQSSLQSLTARAHTVEADLTHRNEAHHERILALELKLREFSGIEESHALEQQASLAKLMDMEVELGRAILAEEHACQHGEVHQKRTHELEVQLAELNKAGERQAKQHDRHRAEMEELAHELKTVQSEHNDAAQKGDEIHQHIANLEYELTRMRGYEKSHEKHAQRAADLEATLAAARQREDRLRRQDMTHQSRIRKLESQLNLPKVKMSLITSLYEDGDDLLGGDVDASPLQLFAEDRGQARYAAGH